MPTTQTHTKTVSGKSSKKPTTQTPAKTVSGKSSKKPTTTATKTGGAKTVSTSQTTGGKWRTGNSRRRRYNILDPSIDWNDRPTYTFGKGDCLTVTRTAKQCVTKPGTPKGEKAKTICSDVNMVVCRKGGKYPRVISGYGTNCMAGCKPNGGLHNPLLARPKPTNAPAPSLPPPSGYTHSNPSWVTKTGRQRKPMNRKK